jgi:hypothetical protein
MNPRMTRLLGAGLFTVFFFVSSSQASFHFMQIEQVIGGVGGNTSAQAIQLRMRAPFQNQMQLARLRVWDHQGQNPVTIIAFPTAVVNEGTGVRVLIASSGFASHTTPTAVPDFTMTNQIPASYMAAGSLTYEDNFGTVYWRLSWGGSNYTGSNLGSITNDADGNFGPPWPNPLPTSGTQAVHFTGAATALSTNNAADYALTTGAAVFVNNAGTSFTVNTPPPTCATCHGDLNGDSHVDAADIQAFVSCFIGGNAGTAGCVCADMDGNGSFTANDVTLFVTRLLSANSACP